MMSCFQPVFFYENGSSFYVAAKTGFQGELSYRRKWLSYFGSLFFQCALLARFITVLSARRVQDSIPLGYANSLEWLFGKVRSMY